VITRISRNAQKSLRTVRGFARNTGLGRITRAQAVALALGDLADQIRTAREYRRADLPMIKAHLAALKVEGKA